MTADRAIPLRDRFNLNAHRVNLKVVLELQAYAVFHAQLPLYHFPKITGGLADEHLLSPSLSSTLSGGEGAPAPAHGRQDNFMSFSGKAMRVRRS